MTRQHPAAAYNLLKTGWKRVVLDLGGVEAAAACSRTTRSLASDFGNVNNLDRFVPVDVVLDAESLGGRPLVTEALALLQGYALVPIEARDAGDLAVKLAEIGRDVAALFATASAALSHAAPTPAEHDDLLRELAEVRRAVSQAERALGAGEAARRLVPRTEGAA